MEKTRGNVVGNRKRCGRNTRENRIRKKDQEKKTRGSDSCWKSSDVSAASQKSLFMKRNSTFFFGMVYVCVMYTHTWTYALRCVYWSIHKYISASWLFYDVPSPASWTISSTDSFTSFWVPSTFFLSFSYYLCVRYIIFAMARLVAAAVSICATPFLFRLPHSSPSLFFHIVIFLLIQKGSETDNLLLCYATITRKSRRKKKMKKRRPNSSGWMETSYSIWYRCWRLFHEHQTFLQIFSIQRSTFIIIGSGG